jgi:hypothetical protein
LNFFVALDEQNLQKLTNAQRDQFIKEISVCTHRIVTLLAKLTQKNLQKDLFLKVTSLFSIILGSALIPFFRISLQIETYPFPKHMLNWVYGVTLIN